MTLTSSLSVLIIRIKMCQKFTTACSILFQTFDSAKFPHFTTVVSSNNANCYNHRLLRKMRLYVIHLVVCNNNVTCLPIKNLSRQKLMSKLNEHTVPGPARFTSKWSNFSWFKVISSWFCEARSFFEPSMTTTFFGLVTATWYGLPVTVTVHLIISTKLQHSLPSLRD